MFLLTAFQEEKITFYFTYCIVFQGFKYSDKLSNLFKWGRIDFEWAPRLILCVRVYGVYRVECERC